MTPEGRVKAKIRQLLNSFGEDAYTEMPVPGGFGKSGLDYNVCFFGRWISIEAKRPGETLTDRQLLRRREIIRAGGKVFGIDGTEDPTITPDLDMQKFSDLQSYLGGIFNEHANRRQAA